MSIDATRRPPLRLRVGRFWARSPVGLVALVLVFAAMAAAFLGPVVTPHDPLAHDLENRLEPPSAQHLMGTDNFGRDVLSRVIHGARNSLTVGLVSVAVVTVLGTLLGVASALAGGSVDLIAQRLVDTLIAFPALVLALVLVAAFGPSTAVVIAAVVVALVPQLMRLARASCLELQGRDHVLAARSLGASAWRIMVRHILPHAIPSVLVLASGFVGKALVLEAALSFLGLGIPPPAPAWGRMIFEGASLYLETAPWLTVFPGLALSLVVVAFALLGDALHDQLDPHSQHRATATTKAQGQAHGGRQL